MQRSVLVVDDSRLARMVVGQILAKAQPGWRLTEAGNAGEAMATLSTQAVDIVLIDFNMPGTDGLELAARIRESRPDVPIAIISANAQDAIVARARALDATFLEKPLTEEILTPFLAGAALRLRRSGH